MVEEIDDENDGKAHPEAAQRPGEKKQRAPGHARRDNEDDGGLYYPATRFPRDYGLDICKIEALVILG
jgi:hypothetical protein